MVGDFYTVWHGHEYVGVTGARAFCRDMAAYMGQGCIYTPMPPYGVGDPAPHVATDRVAAGASLYRLWCGRALEYIERYNLTAAERTRCPKIGGCYCV